MVSGKEFIKSLKDGDRFILEFDDGPGTVKILSVSKMIFTYTVEETHAYNMFKWFELETLYNEGKIKPVA